MKAVNENETKRDGRAVASRVIGVITNLITAGACVRGSLICSPFKRCRSQTEKSTMPREPPHGRFETERTTLKGARLGGVLKEIRLT
jgi:hypothetical protein